MATIIPLVNLNELILSRSSARYARFVRAILSEHTLCDAGELVGQSRGQHIVVQPLSRCRQPWSKAVLHPLAGPDEHNAGCLHEQHAQVAITTLSDTAQDRSIAGRHLLRHEAKPGSKIAPTGEGSA